MCGEARPGLVRFVCGALRLAKMLVLVKRVGRWGDFSRLLRLLSDVDVGMVTAWEAKSAMLTLYLSFTSLTPILCKSTPYGG